MEQGSKGRCGARAPMQEGREGREGGRGQSARPSQVTAFRAFSASANACKCSFRPQEVREQGAEQLRREQISVQEKIGGRVGGKAIQGHHISCFLGNLIALWSAYISSKSLQQAPYLMECFVKTGSSCGGIAHQRRVEECGGRALARPTEVKAPLIGHFK